MEPELLRNAAPWVELGFGGQVWLVLLPRWPRIIMWVTSRSAHRKWCIIEPLSLNNSKQFCDNRPLSEYFSAKRVLGSTISPLAINVWNVTVFFQIEVKFVFGTNRYACTNQNSKYCSHYFEINGRHLGSKVHFIYPLKYIVFSSTREFQYELHKMSETYLAITAFKGQSDRHLFLHIWTYTCNLIANRCKLLVR